MAVLGEHNVGDEVTVAAEALEGIPVVGIVMVQLPHDQSLVSGRRENSVGELAVGGDLGDPVRVSNQGSLQNQLFRLTHSHFGKVFTSV